jgi:hypothetical protein
MDMCHSASGGWAPPWAYDEVPHAALIVENRPRDVAVTWKPAGAPTISDAVADFLEARQETLGERELSSEVNFLYVAVRRPPRPREDTSEIGVDTPIAEFGYGAPPTSPEEWPLVELRSLLRASLAALRHRGSP